MLGNILAVGLMSMGMGLSGVKDEPQMYAENEATYSITYESLEELESNFDRIYTNLHEEYGDNSISITGTAEIVYNSETHNITIANVNTTTNQGFYTAVRYKVDNNNWIQIKKSEDNTMSTIYQSAVGGPPTEYEISRLEMTITGETYYNLAKQPEPNMGNDIIGTIASGLGIIGALATTFLAGFGHLFYVEGALTPFAIFALVMLGIAVSFAVVKLVLNLIRSNTGA